MSTRRKRGNDGRGLGVVIVAVKIAKEISRTALTWALSNVVRDGDCIRLLVVIPYHSSSNRLWGFSNFHRDCISGYWRSMSDTGLEQKECINEICNQMMCQLLDFYDPDKVTVKLKVVYGSKEGVVASEAKKFRSQWVILDKGMKTEAHFCMEQLDCNVIVVKSAEPKVLRLNLTELKRMETKVVISSKSSRKHANGDFDLLEGIKVPNVTPMSSPDRVFSVSSLDTLMSPDFMSEINWERKVKQILPPLYRENYFDDSDSESDSDNVSTLSASVSSQQWMEDDLSPENHCSRLLKEGLQRSSSRAANPMFKTCQLSELRSKGTNRDRHKSMRTMVSLSKSSPADPPPLCSICQHKSPSFGEPPRMFSYTELEQATSRFSQANFLAEGGYGSVYHGVLHDGLAIAVKQHKLASTQGDREFSSEVQVLSCAQHRNVVMLIGYCVEDRRRLLVYEYICNGSLDAHLYGHNRTPLNWAARQKIAIGAARGLRYLHEECRVGCIVHRDMRPNNILLTHDFEPLVGDFGLARFQPDGEAGVETRIIGTFGYIAPEYAQTGQVSEKADVYSFGVILAELVTGRKAIDMNRPRGEQCLTEWIRPLLEENAVSKLVDPRLMDCFSEKDVHTMLHCASLCIQRNPRSRPRMSQVLRMLEGDT